MRHEVGTVLRQKCWPTHLFTLDDKLNDTQPGDLWLVIRDRADAKLLPDFVLMHMSGFKVFFDSSDIDKFVVNDV